MTTAIVKLLTAHALAWQLSNGSTPQFRNSQCTLTLNVSLCLLYAVFTLANNFIFDVCMKLYVLYRANCLHEDDKIRRTLFPCPT